MFCYIYAVHKTTRYWCGISCLRLPSSYSGLALIVHARRPLETRTSTGRTAPTVALSKFVFVGLFERESALHAVHKNTHAEAAAAWLSSRLLAPESGCV
jgi:hypothetical protein